MSPYLLYLCDFRRKLNKIIKIKSNDYSSIELREFVPKVPGA